MQLILNVSLDTLIPETNLYVANILVVKKVAIHALTTKSMIGDLRVRPRVNEFNVVNRHPFSYSAFL